MTTTFRDAAERTREHYDRRRAALARNGNKAVQESIDDPHRLARLFLADHTIGRLFTLRYWRGEWWQWNGSWTVLPDDELKGQLCQRTKKDFDERWRKEYGAWEAGHGKKGPPPVARKVTNKLLSDVTNAALMAIAMLPASVKAPAWLEDDAPFAADEVLVCKNALVHLPTWANGQLATHQLTPAFFSVNALDYDFSAKPAVPREWIAFLNKLWPDDVQAIETLQEWFGYSLLTDTSQQKILMLVGPKRSGKGTIARILRALVGTANAASPTLASLGMNFGLAPLLNKTVAIISDARLSGRTDVAVVVERLLSISGEDAQTIDRKYLSSITTTLPARFTILTNELPRLNDPSGAVVGRLIILRLTRSWYGMEDTTLTNKLMVELAGILHWSMEGWRRLRERGHFVQPKSAAQLVTTMEDLASPIGAFVRERCEVGAGYEVEIKELFEEWKRWCEEKERDPSNSIVFGRDLRAAVPGVDDYQPRREGVRVRCYQGIRLREVEADGPVVTPF